MTAASIHVSFLGKRPAFGRSQERDGTQFESVRRSPAKIRKGSSTCFPVSEVLSRKRPLTIKMIRRLNKEMRISAEVLIRPYDVEKMTEA